MTSVEAPFWLRYYCDFTTIECDNIEYQLQCTWTIYQKNKQSSINKRTEWSSTWTIFHWRTIIYRRTTFHRRTIIDGRKVIQRRMIIQYWTIINYRTLILYWTIIHKRTTIKTHLSTSATKSHPRETIQKNDKIQSIIYHQQSTSDHQRQSSTKVPTMYWSDPMPSKDGRPCRPQLRTKSRWTILLWNYFSNHTFHSVKTQFLRIAISSCTDSSSFPLSALSAEQLLDCIDSVLNKLCFLFL